MKNLAVWLLLSQVILRTDALYGFENLNNILNRLVLIKQNLAFNYYSPQRRQFTVTKEYDFIIIGSGSAGSVVANRLSENPDWNVLLLEAGNPANLFSQIPIMAPILQLTPFNWGYNMEKQSGLCNAMEEGICSWPRGRALGGTTVINYMIYTRGNPLDFQKWESQGNPGWSYENVLPYYLKSERCNLGDECFTKYHNSDGYLSTEYPFTSKLTEAFLKAGDELGHNKVDYNTPNYMGFSKIQANLNRGRRHSASAAFLEPFVHRANLEIITSARVTKILIDPNTNEAYGVEYYKANEKYTVYNKKEVILSAGTFHSPQLLMLSGVGPKEHLEELSIPVLQNLPVGQTLYDHIAYLTAIFTINETVVSPQQTVDPVEIVNWFSTGKGFLSSLGGVEALAYVKTNVSTEKADYPDIELILTAIGSLQFDFGLFSRRELRVRQDVYDEFFRPLENTPCYAIMPMLLHPKSKGYLKLRSSDPLDPPLLYGNYFTDTGNHDIKTMIAGVRFIQELSKAEAFQKLGAKPYEKPVPGCENFIFDSDEYWTCALGSFSITLHHQIATCKMGSKDDSEAVVDERLRVHGVKNLRVADSSVIPVTLSAHTSAPSMMIGEKISDILKEDWSG